jgi:hypothetical protein
MFSFILGSRQRVKIGILFSDWLELEAGFPQGAWLGPLAFIILMDDLNPSFNVQTPLYEQVGQQVGNKFMSGAQDTN